MSAVNTDDGNFILAGYTDSKDGDVIGDGLKRKHGAHDAWIIHLQNTTVNTRDVSFSNQINIFPTYVSDFIQIKVKEGYSNLLKVEIFNTGGQMMMSKNLNCFQGGCEENIAVRAFLNGIYLVEVCDDTNNCTTRKIVKVNAKY